MKKLFHLSSKDLSKLQIIDWAYTEDMSVSGYEFYLSWLEKGLHGDLNYLADERREKRKSLKSFFPECESALVFLFDYTHAAKENINNQDHKLASYVKGFEHKDYHLWIKDKLTKIAEELKLGSYQLSIDAQPVLERDLAFKTGLGWFGKNSMLISKKHGSFFIIASILVNKKLNLATNKDLEPDHCGTCTRCIDACPTNAIIDDKIIDAQKCISHFTIELFKDTERPDFFAKEQEEIFGCDICQNVCPWNQKPLERVELQTSPGVLDFFKQDLKLIKSQLEEMSNREFRRYFKHTPLERTGRVGLLKNISLKD